MTRFSPFGFEEKASFFISLYGNVLYGFFFALISMSEFRFILRVI